MALNVKDEKAVRLAGEVAAITGESKTRAIRVALQERLERLRHNGPHRESSAERGARLRRFLEDEVWPQIPESERNRPLTRAEREEILGYGEHGA
jgi:antitoxin VapB